MPLSLYEDDEKFNYYYYSHFYDGKMNEFTTNIQTDYNLFSPQCPSLNDFNNTFNNIINISDNSEYKNEDEDKDVDKGELYEQEDPEIILSEYHPTKISQIFEKSEKLKPFLNAFDNNLIDENIQNEIKGNLIKKKRIRRTASEIANERMEKNKEIKKKKKKGRLKNDTSDGSIGAHNKFSSDNIIKKIKTNLFNYLIIFINSIIPKECKKYSLKKLKYDYANQLKKDNEINCLNMTLKVLLSLDISPKYTMSDAKINKINIEKILDIQKNNEYINNIFNMTFRKWIDIFLMKKESNIIISGVEDLLADIYKKNDNDNHYFSCFVYYMYNYEKWFIIKKGRNTQVKKKLKKNNINKK